LTLRQVQLIVHAANGLTFKEIAEAEMISPKTVANTLDEARRRAGASNVTHLVALCVSAGIVLYNDDLDVV
jgi:DNA-binding CsgD family transcriptional regulator